MSSTTHQESPASSIGQAFTRTSLSAFDYMAEAERHNTQIFWSKINNAISNVSTDRLCALYGIVPISPGKYGIRQHTFTSPTYKSFNVPKEDDTWEEPKSLKRSKAKSRQKYRRQFLDAMSTGRLDLLPAPSNDLIFQDVFLEARNGLLLDSKFLRDAFVFLGSIPPSLSSVRKYNDEKDLIKGRRFLPKEIQMCILDKMSLLDADLAVKTTFPDLTKWWVERVPRLCEAWFSALCSRGNLRFLGDSRNQTANRWIRKRIYRFESVNLNPTFTVGAWPSNVAIPVPQELPQDVSSILMNNLKKEFFHCYQRGFMNSDSTRWFNYLSAMESKLLLRKNVLLCLRPTEKTPVAIRQLESRAQARFCLDCLERNMQIHIQLDPLHHGSVLVLYFEELREIFKYMKLMFQATFVQNLEQTMDLPEDSSIEGERVQNCKPDRCAEYGCPQVCCWDRRWEYHASWEFSGTREGSAGIFLCTKCKSVSS